LEKPGSMTKTTPSIVREVSAMFVETTHFLPKNTFFNPKKKAFNLAKIN